MFQYLDARGISSSVAARECGIALTWPPDSDARVGGAAMERLWDYVVHATRDPLIGLHLAESYNPGALDILGYVVLNCSTVGDVLDRLSRYVHVLNDGLHVELVRTGATAYCRATFVTSRDNYLLRRSREAIDSLWGGLARELRRLPVRPVRAAAVWLRLPQPSAADAAEYERVLGVPVHFGASEDRFIFASADLDEPIVSANPALLQAFEKHADDVLSRITRAGTPTRRVMEVVASRMKGTVPTLTEVARELAMSDRNLQRALRSDGTSYVKVVDELRKDLALSHLSTPGTSAGQVGFLLGFSEPSAFHRAFRRWTGQGPGAFMKRVG